MACINIDNILFQCQATLYRSRLVYLATTNSNKQVSTSQRSKNDLIHLHPFLKYTTINIFIHAEKAAGYRASLLYKEKHMLQYTISLELRMYQCLNGNSIVYLAVGTTILYKANADNIVNVIISILSGGEDIIKET